MQAPNLTKSAWERSRRLCCGCTDAYRHEFALWIRHSKLGPYLRHCRYLLEKRRNLSDIRVEGRSPSQFSPA